MNDPTPDAVQTQRPQRRLTNRGTGEFANGGWFRLSNAIIYRISEIGCAALAVYVVLAQHAGASRMCWPSMFRISQCTGLTKRSIIRATKRLEAAELIAVTRSEEGKRKTLNVYRLLTVPPQKHGDSTAPTNGVRRATTTLVPASHNPSDKKGLSVVTGAHHEQDLREQDSKNKTKRAPAGAGSSPDQRLLELIDCWNALGDRIVKNGNGVRRDPPSAAVLKGWGRLAKDAELRDAFADLPQLAAAIRRARFCHGKGWFTLAWLFGKNKNGELNAVKLLNGAYDHADSSKRDVTPGPGQRFDAGTTRKAGPGW